MDKRYEYVVTLKKNSQRTTDLFSLGLSLIAFFSFLAAQLSSQRFNYFLSAAALILLAGILFIGKKSRTLRQNRLAGIPEQPKDLVRYKYILLIAAIGWLAMPHLQWLFIPYIALAFFEYQAKHPIEVGFDQKEIVINTLQRKYYRWTDLTNVILRDGLLTLDFRDNRIFQKEVLDDEDGEADEDEFNDYCRRQLASAHSAPRP